MNRAIASLALVKTVWETYRRDYIENFVPFVATLTHKKRYTEINTSNLAYFLEDFKVEFGLSIPHHPMLTILDRARKRDIFQKKGAILIPVKKFILKYDFSDKAVKKEAEVNKVLTEFIKFCDEKFAVKVLETEAQDALNSFLRNHDLEVLFASQDKTLLPDSKASKQLKYLICSFFNSVKTQNPSLFQYIIEISIGHVLASTILYDKGFNKYAGHLRKLEIYLDSRYIFRLFAIEGNDYGRVYTELTNSMLEQEAELFVFRHTADEILGILRNCLRWINSTDYDPVKANTVLLYFINNGKTESDIHQYIATFESRLESYKIGIKEAPDFTKTPSAQIDEPKLKAMIVENYKKNLYFNETDKQATINRDIKSISAINHLRNGRMPQTIKSAGSIFVTPNGGLAFVNKKFEDEIFSGRQYIPACLTDIFVGTLVWMQSPKKWIQINEKKVLADCTAAIQPDDLFIKKMVEEARKLEDSGGVTSDEYLAVSRSYLIHDMLMKKTLGDPEAVNGACIQEVLKKIKTDAASIPEQMLSVEKEKNQELEEQLRRYKQDSIQKRLRIKRLVRTTMTGVFSILFFISLVLLAVSIVVPFLPMVGLIWKMFSCVLTIFFALFSVGYGFNLKGWKENMIDKISDNVALFLENEFLKKIN
jgi:hypothetical protein